MADQPIIQLAQPPPAPRGPLAFWSALDPAVKVVVQLGALVSAIAVGVQAYNALVTEGELGVVRSAQARVDQVQDAVAEQIDEDTELLFQTTVRLSTQMDEVQRSLVDVRLDLRRMDRGQPLPAISPNPTRPP